MVGVPKSNGCQLCLARKVRCDEARPACGNCVKYGAECPGYDRSLKFVVGKHAVRPRKQARSKGEQPSSSSSSAKPPGQAPGRRARTAAAIKTSGEIGDKSKTNALALAHTAIWSTILLVGPIKVDKGQFIGMMVSSVRNEQPADDMLVFRSWFDQALSRLGSTQLLDMATCSFALQMLGKGEKDPNLLAQSRTLYGQSLGHLQAALNHPEDWKTPETLCSATLLCLFEVSVSPSSSQESHLHCARE
jgi:hypothetical protein